MNRDQIVLSHQTALLYHRARRLASARGQELEAHDSPAIAALLGLPHLDVLVAPGQPRPRSSIMRVHIRSGLDPLPYCEVIAPKIMVCSPELALWQLGCSSADESAALLAYEACGTFAPDATMPDGCLYDLPPICSTEKIRRVANDLNDFTGERRGASLSRMLTSVVDLAASPAEARLCLAMVAPRLMGGYGLPKPQLNVNINVSGAARSLTNKRMVKPDGIWYPRRVVYEYQGVIHATKERLESDAGRDNALLAMGYRVIHITRKQVGNYDLYRGLMETLRLTLGVRKDLPSPRILERQYQLWKRLFKSGGIRD